MDVFMLSLEGAKGSALYVIIIRQWIAVRVASVSTPARSPQHLQQVSIVDTGYSHGGEPALPTQNIKQ